MDEQTSRNYSKEIAMPTGLRLKIDGQSFSQAFQVESGGFVSVREDALDWNRVVDNFRMIQNARGVDTPRRISDLINSADVTFVDRPEGATPVRGAGVRMFGPRPRRPSQFDAGSDSVKRGKSDDLDVRRDKIRAKAQVYIDACQANLDSAENEANRLLAMVEIDQAKTGGGYDNTSAGDTSRSGHKFVMSANGLTPLTAEQKELVVYGAKRLLNEDILASGIRKASLEPVPIQKVRFEQTNDGLLGYPLLKKGNLKATARDAKSLAITYGVDPSIIVGQKVSDKFAGVTVDVRNQDLLGYILDNMTISLSDLRPVIVLLTRIQRHGWKYEDGQLVAKPGKTRSVYPPDALLGAAAAMVFQALQEALMSHQPNFMPSLMKPSDRDRVIFDYVKRAREEGFAVLSADESAYDATLHASIMATIMEIVVKPLFKEEYHSWVDLATASLVYKMILIPSAIMREQGDAVPNSFELRGNTLCGVTNALISGHKGTHIMGSFYLRVVGHYAAAMKLGYEHPGWGGSCAGDDNAFLIPESMVDLESAKKTYSPLADVYGHFGLQLNENKQIFHSAENELVTIFLQKAYHAGLGIKGVGSAFRSIAGVWFSEKDKKYSVAEQLMAELSIMQNGFNSPFIKGAIELWLSDEKVLLAMYQKYSVRTWYMLIAAMGGLDNLLKSLDAGAFQWSVDPEKLERGEPFEINDLAAEVGSSMSPSDVQEEKIQKLVLAEAEDFDE